jgi:predicted phage terminase large subunit-like protein
MIPMEFDPSIYPAADYTGNELGWIDPRALDDDGEMLSPFDLDQRDGDLAWPERFPANVVSGFKYELGPHAYAGQYAQSPTARRGGIFDLAWWNTWDPPESGKFPPMQFVIASLDSAFTEKEENDPSGFTVWGVWIDEEGVRADLAKSMTMGQSMSPDEIEAAISPEMFEGRVPKVMLMAAWRKHLKIHGSHDLKKHNETYANWVKRTQKDWGLCEQVAHTCKRFDVDVLLIEAKANGLSVAQEMERIYGGERWSVHLAQAPNDKVARALAVQSCWSQGIIYAPERDWAEMVKSEMANFPKHRFKDLTDSATHAIAWLRKNGLIQRPEEMARLIRARSEFKKPAPVLYHA